MPAIDQGLYYITHVDNVASILKWGILSHERIESQNIDYRPIYDHAIVSNRSRIKTPSGNSLWQYANFYFQPRNPMLYRVIREVSTQSIVIIKLRKSVLERTDILLTDGNAAHSRTQIGLSASTSNLRKIFVQVDKHYWNDTDDDKRAIMAECLVPDCVPPSDIECIYIARNGEFLKRVQDIVSSSDSKSISVVVEPEFFFQPQAQWRLNRLLSLAQGDMFFSRLQTLTISVNTKGVMGKGLASRTRYQFPDVYVKYEDVCKNKELTTKTPYLHRRSKSLAVELSDMPRSEGDDSETLFLLFATKEHWKENSKIEYIIDGMEWIKANFKTLGIRSLALPALGCGLGGLKWAEVGPILCTTAAQLDIPACIYLPSEDPIPAEQLTSSFLIRS